VAISAAMKTALASHGVRLVFGVEINGIKISIDGSSTSTVQLLAGSEPWYNESTSQWFREPWELGLRFKRSAQSVLTASGATVVVNNYGSFIFPNYNKELDADWGAAGYSTAGQSTTVTLQAIPNQYSRLAPEVGTLFSGLLEEHTFTDEALTVPAVSLASKLNTRIATERILAVDFDNLPEVNIGRVKPLLLGTCYNVQLISVDPLDQGGKFLVAYHGCESGTFYRNGLVMAEGVDYTMDWTGDSGGTFLTLINARQGATITGDVEGIRPAHLGIFSDKLTELNLEVFIQAGLALVDFDTAGLADCRSEYDYSMGLAVTEEASALEVFTQLNGGIPIIFEQFREGGYLLSPWTNPTGTAEITLAEDIETFSSTLAESPLIREVIYTYAPYETAQSFGDLATTLQEDDPDRVDRLAQSVLEYRDEISSTSTDIPPLTAATRINSLADITDLATKVLSLYGKPHIQISTSLRSVGAAIRGIGSVISFSRERQGLNKLPLLARVADMEEVWDSGGVTTNLILWKEATL